MARTAQNGTFLETIGRHLECAIQTELVVEPDTMYRPTPNQKESNLVDFNAILSYARKVQKSSRIGWHCAKVKSRVELKIDKKE